MRYRKLDFQGDYTFGRNEANLYFDSTAVAQAAQTRLQLFKDSFWRDLGDGLPLFQNILTTPGSQSNIQSITNIIEDRVRKTEGVLAITKSHVEFDPTNRQFTYTLSIQTNWSVEEISGVI